ncbi:uncharacterized protein [Leptinotarsa decemlineata]|uniref:uncharacterized protein n=1 Tax=Leptinotarsa decemlineata TaxID=7539 RepID=UPI000C252659|nr:zinc finger protein 836-like [Leptinotarsa decemlineata]
MKQKRNKYEHHTKITLMCRICLTQSNNVMYKLEEEFEIQDALMSYLEALEYVTTSKIVVNGDYPENICPVCASVLKMAFEFIKQFKESQLELRKRFNHDLSEPEFDGSVKREKEDNTPNVELIFQNNKFNINDLLVVEKQETENCTFEGFLGNLGKEVTATFVENLESKNCNNIVKDIISVSVIGKDRIIPVSQLQIDEDANVIEYVLDENSINHASIEENSTNGDSLSEQSESIEINMNDESLYENKNIEFIVSDIPEQDTIESLIIDRTEITDDNSATENTCNNGAPRRKKVVKVGKRRKKTIMKEIEDEFEKEIKFICEICQSIFQTRKSLKAHKRVHFPKEETFTCEICGYLCKTRSAFIHHRLKHDEKKFQCQLCDKAYRTKAVLKVHMDTHANKRQHLCNVCGKGFNYPIALRYHMRLHTGEKNYNCEFCNKSFRMKNSLNRHRRTHTGDRPYRCKFCSRKFFSRGEVTCHEYTHTGYRPYHCKYCRRGFSKTHNLKVHLLSHSGDYQCNYCRRSFIEGDILSMHYKISHKDRLQQDEGESTDSHRGNDESLDFSDQKQASE